MGIFKRLTDNGRESGFEETMEYDPGSDQIVTHRRFDNEPVMKQNAEMRKADDGFTADRTMKRVARIPLGIAELWLNEYGVSVYKDEDMEAVMHLLDSKDWSSLKTSEGTASKKPLRSYYRASSAKLVRYGDE